MLPTLLFYNFILFGSTAMVYLSERAKTVLQQKILMFGALLLVALPVGLRYGLGRDYQSYHQIFDAISGGYYYGTEELGFVWLNKIIASLGMDYAGFTIIFSFFIYAIAMRGYPKGHKALVHFLFVVLFFLNSFTQIRSVFVLSIMLIAFMQYRLDGKAWKFSLYVVGAAFFHVSALMLIIIPYVDKIFFQRATKLILPLGLAIVALSYLYGQTVTNYIFNMSITSDLGYARYADSVYNVKAEFSTGLGYIANLLILCSVLPFCKKLIKDNKYNNICIILVFACLVCAMLRNISAIFGRLELTFGLAFLFVPLLIAESSRIKNKRYLVLGILFLMFATFNRAIIGGGSNYQAACVDKADMYYPYTTIFNKKSATNPMKYGCP